MENSVECVFAAVETNLNLFGFESNSYNSFLNLSNITNVIIRIYPFCILDVRICD